MRKALVFIIVILIVIDIMLMAWIGVRYSDANKNLIELEDQIDQMGQGFEIGVIFSVIEEPNKMFQYLEDAPAWEEVDAVPYSKCYRHLIGDETLTADYIMCMAI